MYNSLEDSLNRIEEGLVIDQRKGNRMNEIEQYAKELKKIKKYPSLHAAASSIIAMGSPKNKKRLCM